MTLIFSNRASTILQSPRHENSGLLHWLSSVESDKILTLQYPSGSDDLQRILNEGLATLLENKKISVLFALSFREFDSFLRDQNHLPAFKDDTNPGLIADIEKRFQTTKMQMLAAVVADSLKKMGMEMPLFSNDLVQKNRLALWLSEKTSSFIPEERRWEIALYDGDILYLRIQKKSWQDQELEVLFSELWAQLDLPLPLKVVAVP